MHDIYNKILILFLESNLKITSIEKLQEYIWFCLVNNTGKIKRKTSNHHILPQSNSLPFKYYSDFKDSPWNCSTLTHSNHYMSHYLLTLAIEHYSIIYSFTAMNNKDIANGRLKEGDLIGSDEYERLMELRSQKQKEWLETEIIDENGNTSTNMKEISKKRLKTMEEKNWEGFGESVSKGLLVVEDNGKTKAHNAVKRGVNNRLSKDKDSYKKSAKLRLENMSKDIDENGLNGVERMRINQQEAQSEIGKDGMNSWERRAQKRKGKNSNFAKIFHIYIMN